MEFSRQEYWTHSLLQGIFLTQRSKPGLLHCRETLYHLSHQGSPLLRDKRRGFERELSIRLRSPACAVWILTGLPRWLSGKEMLEMWVQSLGQENTLEEEMATHPRTLAREIPWTETRLAGYSQWVSES